MADASRLEEVRHAQSPAEAAAGRGVRPDPPRRPDPPDPPGQPDLRRREVAPARRRRRPRREPARRPGPRDPRGDRARRRGRRHRARLLRPPAVACGARAGGGTTRRSASCTTRGCRPTRPRRGWTRSTARPSAAAWHPVADVLSGALPVTDIVTEALADHRRSGCSGSGSTRLIRRDDAVLLTRISTRGFHSGSWTLPGGGLDHGESPRDALAREVREECGVDVRGRRPARRPRPPLRRHGAVGPLRGLPRRPPGLPGHRRPTTPSRGSSRSTAPPTPSPGCRSPRSRPGPARRARRRPRRAAQPTTAPRLDRVNPRHRRLVIPRRPGGPAPDRRDRRRWCADERAAAPRAGPAARG